MSNQEKRTSIGGQALIEGIMMRGPYKQAIAVPGPGWRDRPQDRGIEVYQGSVSGSWMAADPRRSKFWRVHWWRAVKALMYSASFYPEEEDAGEPGRFEQWLSKHVSSEKLESLIIYAAVTLGVLFSVGLFMLRPPFWWGWCGPFTIAICFGIFVRD